MQAQLSATLRSKDIGVAVAVLVKKFSPQENVVGVDDSAGRDNGAGGGRGGTFEARAHAAAACLEGLKVVFVKELRSRFLRIEARHGGVTGEEDITAPTGAVGSLFFVKEVGLWTG